MTDALVEFAAKIGHELFWGPSTLCAITSTSTHHMREDSAMMESVKASAMRAVLDLPELLEQIILMLPMRKILTTGTRVSKA